MDNRHRRWQNRTEFVMIRDHRIDAALSGPGDGLHCRAATIDGDQQLRAGIDEVLDGLCIQAVAFFHTMRDVILDVGSGCRKGMPEHGGSGDAIDVIIAIESDFLAGPRGGGDARGGGIDVGQEGRRMQIAESRLEKRRSGARIR